MLLAIDCGNTNIVFSVFEDDSQIHDWRIETKAGRTADEYTSWLSHLLSLSSLSLDQIKDVVIASVVPAVTQQLRLFAEKAIKVTPIIVGDEGVALGIDIDIDMPSQVGADRVVNALAASQMTDKPTIILDFGTATTFDIVRKGAIYAGGVIAPGIHLSVTALSHAAARLPEIEIAPFGEDMPVVGRDTRAAMRSGIFWGYVAMIEGIIARIEQAEGTKMHLIATGGLASLFAPHISAIKQVESALTMQGLLAIYKMNKRT